MMMIMIISIAIPGRLTLLPLFHYASLAPFAGDHYLLLFSFLLRLPPVTHPLLQLIYAGIHVYFPRSHFIFLFIFPEKKKRNTYASSHLAIQLYFGAPLSLFRLLSTPIQHIAFLIYSC